MGSYLRSLGAGTALALGIALIAPDDAAGQAPVVTTPHFAFYSRFETNLNDGLIAAATARKFRKAELFRSAPEDSCFARLDAAARTGWDSAVDYYGRVVAPGGSFGRQQFTIRMALAGIDPEPKDTADRHMIEAARAARDAARSAYQACRWRIQDEANRRWLDQLVPRLAVQEQRIGARLEQLYGTRWGRLPIPVDVVQTVDWSGANSVLTDSGGGHILIAIENQGAAALEVVFHEASHLLMGRNDPVQQALERAAAGAGRQLPGDFWHVVLFFTTGEAIRRILDQSGAPAYTPMLYEIFGRGTWSEFRESLETAWRPYVFGERSLSEAADALIRALPRSG